MTECTKSPGLLLILSARWCVALLLAGCSPDNGAGTLTRSMPNDDTVELRADWDYSSFEVDVALTLVTRTSPDGCVSTGTLSVDEALKSRRHYDLAPTACAELELTAGGDLVLQGSPTGHDWSGESLSVDTDAELISLGPAPGTDENGQASTFVFTLSAPPCADAPDCSCGVLRRSSTGGKLELPLGRRC